MVRKLVLWFFVVSCVLASWRITACAVGEEKWFAPKAANATFKSPSEELSTWEKLNASTKAFLVRTKNTLMPWSISVEKEPKSRSVAAGRRSHRPATRPQAKESSKSLFSSWFQREEEEKKIETVNDFLALPPVPYE